MSSTANAEAGAHHLAGHQEECDPLTDPELTDPELELFLARFEVWCEAHGLAMSTVCMRVLGNSRAVTSMRNQARRTREKIRKLEEHMLEAERKPGDRQHKP